MKKGTTHLVIRIVLGIALIFFGLNTFLQFMPAPTFNEAGTQFLTALFASGYIFPIIAILQFLIGILLLTNRCVPLAAVLLMPLSINYVLFHIFLDLTGWLFAIIIFLSNIYLLYAHWDAYRPLCK